MTRLPQPWVASLAIAAGLLLTSGATAAPPAAGPQPATQPAAQARRSSMQPVHERAAAMTRHALESARKGMLFSARDELTQALRLVAQALDVQQQRATHVAALSAGLTALDEARDFAPRDGGGAAPIDVSTLARTHRTPLFGQGAGGMSPVVAQQHYFNFAQQQLALAVGGEPAASQSLYALGKIQMALAEQTTEQQSLHAPQAMVFHQAALAVDPRNHLAANELGVLLARYGQLEAARQALVHSVTLQPHAEGWHNLAVVHQRLGQTELAQLAENERRLLAGGAQPGPRQPVNQSVEWLDPRTFA
ncbi:MAG: hypothetical protein WD872_00055, partial [Pirellulaceae bacterium]